jgi:hypothetical protein
MTSAGRKRERDRTSGPAPRVTVTALPYADAPPSMQRAVRLIRLLEMLDPELADETIDIDERDVANFYGTG